MDRLLTRQIVGKGFDAKQIPGYDNYILTSDKVVYRVWPYAMHTVKNGWVKRFRLKELLPRGKSKMVCLSDGQRRVEVSIAVLVRQVFGS